MSLWPTNHSMRGEPPHLEGPSDAPGRLTSYPTSGKVQSKEEPFLFEDVLRDELRLIKERRKVLFPRIVNEDSSPIGETDTPGTSLAGRQPLGKRTRIRR